MQIEKCKSENAKCKFKNANCKLKNEIQIPNSKSKIGSHDPGQVLDNVISI